MKKLISILLLLFFANPIFATTPPTPKVETTLNINITETTKKNLKKAAESFDLEIQKARNNNCKGENSKKNFCTEKFSTTQKLIKGIEFSTPATKEDFEQIVAFYNELKNFKELQANFEILNSKTKIDIIAHYELLKTDLKKLIEKLNKENELLNTALKNAENENEIPTTTITITKEQFEKINTKINTINPKINTINPKINIKELKLEQHEAIEIPTIPSTEELNNMNDTEELTNILINLQNIQTRINKETEIADSNIAKLEGNDKNINDALQNLKKEKIKQTELLSQLGKNITINDGNDNVENTELENNFPAEAKDPTYYKPNKVVEELTVENIEKETQNVQNNNKLLEKYIEKLEKCKNELKKYTNNINDINTLEKCNEKTLEEQEIVEQKKCIFTQLQDCSSKIESKKISLFGTNSSLKDGNPDGYSYLKESTRDENCGSKTNPIYGIIYDETKNRILYDSILYRLFKPETECKIPGQKIEIISVDAAEEKLKTCIGNLTLLNEIEKKCGNITPIQKAGTNYIDKYITVNKKLNKCENNKELFEGKATDQIGENEVIKECINTLKSQKCLDFIGLINNSDLAKKLNELGVEVNTTYNKNNPEQCIKELNQNNCQAYIDASNATNITLSEIEERNIGKNTTEYLDKCKEYVDEKKINDLISRLNNACTGNLPTQNDINLLKDIQKIYDEMNEKECPSGNGTKALSIEFKDLITQIKNKFEIPHYPGNPIINSCANLGITNHLFTNQLPSLNEEINNKKSINDKIKCKKK